MEVITTEHNIGDGVSISIGAPHLLNGVIVGKDGVRLKVELETEYAMAQGRVVIRDMFVLPSAIIQTYDVPRGNGALASMPYAGNPSDLTYNELYSKCVQVFGEDEARDEMYDIILQVNQDKDPHYDARYNMEWHNAYMAYLYKAENAGRPSEYTQFRNEVLVVLGTPKELCEQVMSAPEDDDVPLSVGKTLKDATSFIVKAVNTAYGLADQSLFDKDLYENYVEFLKANTGELILKLKRDLEHASLFAFGYETERYYELSDKDKTAYTTDIMRVIRVTNAIAGVDSIAFQPYLAQYYIYWGIPYVSLEHYAPPRIEVDDVIKTVNLKHEPMFPNDYMPSRDSEYRSEIDRLIKESLSSGG